MATGSEHLLGKLLQKVLPTGWYVPGMGLAAGLALIIFVGLLSHVIIFQRLFGLGERILEKLPLVKNHLFRAQGLYRLSQPGQEIRIQEGGAGAVAGHRFSAHRLHHP